MFRTLLIPAFALALASCAAQPAPAPEPPPFLFPSLLEPMEFTAGNGTKVEAEKGTFYVPETVPIPVRARSGSTSSVSNRRRRILARRSSTSRRQAPAALAL